MVPAGDAATRAARTRTSAAALKAAQTLENATTLRPNDIGDRRYGRTGSNLRGCDNSYQLRAP